MSENNIINISQIPNIIGAESSDCAVVIENKSIPKMRCIDNGDTITLILDRRFSYTFPKEWAFLAAAFAAQSMAIGAGYSHLGAPNKDKPFAPEIMHIDIETLNQPIKD